MMDQEINVSTKRRGRPATGKGFTIGVRLQPDALAWLDAEREKIDPIPSRPEMVRLILSQAKGKGE